jgi:hypothetical protein
MTEEQTEQQPFAPDERIGRKVRCCDIGFVGWVTAIRGRMVDVRGIEQVRQDVPLQVIEWLPVD